MTDLDALLAQIRSDLGEYAPRWALADWFQENDFPEFGILIRAQIDLYRRLLDDPESAKLERLISRYPPLPDILTVNKVNTQDRQLAAHSSEMIELEDGGYRHIEFIEIQVLPGQGDMNGLTIGAPMTSGTPYNWHIPSITIFPDGNSFRVSRLPPGYNRRLRITNNSRDVACNYRVTIAGTST